MNGGCPLVLLYCSSAIGLGPTVCMAHNLSTGKSTEGR